MAELTTIGGGAHLEESRRILAAAAVAVGSDLDRDNSPVLLGEAAICYAIARQVIDAGRDLLICNPQLLTPTEVQGLLQSRRPRQVVSVWNPRRQHPANRMIAGLVRTCDPAWEPRLVRATSLGIERPAAALLAWRSLDAITLVSEMIGATPRSVAALEAPGGERGTEDCIALSVGFDHTAAFLQVGLGEAADRHETMLAGPTRKAYVDELDQKVPLRILDTAAAGAARYVACTAPQPQDLTRMQVLAFLECVQQRELADAEASLLMASLAVWRVAQASLAQGGAPHEVDLSEPASEAATEARESATRPSLRLISS
jgi:hypothetical protein